MKRIRLTIPVEIVIDVEQDETFAHCDLEEFDEINKSLGVGVGDWLGTPAGKRWVRRTVDHEMGKDAGR